MEEKKTCGVDHEFVGSPEGQGAKHPLHGKKYKCQLEPGHRGNHVATADSGEQVAWVPLVIV